MQSGIPSTYRQTLNEERLEASFLLRGILGFLSVWHSCAALAYCRQPELGISEKLLIRLRDVGGVDVLIDYRRDFSRPLF